jgi:hypothetical protein
MPHPLPLLCFFLSFSYILILQEPIDSWLVASVLLSSSFRISFLIPVRVLEPNLSLFFPSLVFVLRNVKHFGFVVS